MASTRRLIIDDSDSGIDYIGQWFKDSGTLDSVGNFGPTYMHTEHGTNANNSFYIFFQGA